MRIEKKTVKALVLVCLWVITLFGCGKKQPVENAAETKKDKTKREFFSLQGGGATLTDEYALLPAMAYGSARYFDVTSGKDVIFCFEPNCEHKKPHYDMASHQMLDDTCTAYHMGNGAFVLRDEYGYYFSDLRELVRTDREGKNQKVIGKISEPIEHYYTQIFTEKDFFTTYQNMYCYQIVQDGEEDKWLPTEQIRETVDFGIYRVSMVDGKSTKIFNRDDQYETFIDTMYEYDGHLFFDCHYLDVPRKTLPPVSEEEDYRNNIDRYREEYNRHVHYEVYDYEIATDRLICVLKIDHSVGGVRFGDGFFVTFSTEGGQGYPAAIYRSDGEKLHEMDFAIEGMAQSDRASILGTYEDGAWTYREYDVWENKILREIRLPSGKVLDTAIGDTYYMHVPGGSGYTLAYIRREDFWNGEFDKAVPFTRTPD